MSFGAGRTAISAQASRISTGTAVSNTPSGRVSSRTPPVIAPSVVPVPPIMIRPRWPSSSRRYPHIALRFPSERPTVLETLAVTGA